MAFDAYLKLDTFHGESTSLGFKGWMEIFNFSLGVTNPVTIGSASTGAGGGRCVLQPFSFTKKTDCASPGLFLASASGAHIATGTVQLRKAGGGFVGAEGKVTPVAYLTYFLNVIFIESVSWSGSSGGDDSPEEHVVARFGALTIEYQAQGDDGKPVGGAVCASWNVQTNAMA